MKIHQQPHTAARNSARSPTQPPEVLASQGARRATEEASTSGGSTSDFEVVPRARRRVITHADKRRILGEADLCTLPGQLGALMRREGIYSSALFNWRRLRAAGGLGTSLNSQVVPTSTKRGPKPDPARAQLQADTKQLAQITRERDSLKRQLDKAQLVIAVQKKVASLLALLEPDSKPEST
jgi:transposase